MTRSTVRPGNLQAMVFLAAVLLPGSLSSQLPPGFQDSWQQLSSELRDSLTASGMVGSSWAFVSDGEVVRLETFGFADLATNRRVDENTIYHWGSITKTLTGIAILQLRDKGLLGLDDPILRYVPELESVWNPHGPLEAITLSFPPPESAPGRASGNRGQSPRTTLSGHRADGLTGF